jgi:hypothetical protein
VQAELVELAESLKKTLEEGGGPSESLKQGSDLSIDSNLIDSASKQKVSKLNALYQANSREANESDYHSQIMILLRDMGIINESNQYTIEQKSNLLFEKADEILAKADTFGVKQNFSLPVGTSARVELLLSESSRNYNSLAKLYNYMISILRNVNNTENYETIVNTFEAFKSAEELLAEKFNIFKNETELLGKIRHLADLYLLAISGMKNPSNWALEFKSVCVSIISLIENGGDSKPIPIEKDGKAIYISSNSDQTPWWEEILGSFANDPVYDEAMQLGRQYRESLRPHTESTSTP